MTHCLTGLTSPEQAAGHTRIASQPVYRPYLWPTAFIRPPEAMQHIADRGRSFLSCLTACYLPHLWLSFIYVGPRRCGIDWVLGRPPPPITSPWVQTITLARSCRAFSTSPSCSSRAPCLFSRRRSSSFSRRSVFSSSSAMRPAWSPGRCYGPSW